MLADEWQLEMLCNIGAAELLMPMGCFPEIGNEDFSIDRVLQLRDRFQVSTEAVLHRFLRRSRLQCGIFAASQKKEAPYGLAIDYLRTTSDWIQPMGSGFNIPSDSVLNDCRAIGYTSKGKEKWMSKEDAFHVEGVAVAPYPGADDPRVVGLIRPLKSVKSHSPTIQYLIGDATKPRGQGERLIAHVVNDATPRWGGGFAKVVGRAWQVVQDDFIQWVAQDKSRLRLGNSHLCRIDESTSIFHLIAQHGYGETRRPRIRYQALQACLASLSDTALQMSATVHMPRIGCGQAGGKWPLVAEFIDNELCRAGVPVTIYDLPSERTKWEQRDAQKSLFDIHSVE